MSTTNNATVVPHTQIYTVMNKFEASRMTRIPPETLHDNACNQLDDNDVTYKITQE